MCEPNVEIKLEKNEENTLEKMVKVWLSPSKDEAARAAIIKYASYLESLVNEFRRKPPMEIVPLPAAYYKPLFSSFKFAEKSNIR